MLLLVITSFSLVCVSSRQVILSFDTCCCLRRNFAIASREELLTVKKADEKQLKQATKY